MKVSLVRLPFTTESKLFPPFGLVNLASYLEERGYEVGICDLQTRHSFGEVLESQVVGFTCFSSQLSHVKAYINYLRQHGLKHSKIMVGGPCVTAHPEKTREILGDVELVVGDGECWIRNEDRKFYDFKNHLIPSWNLIDYRRYVRTTGLAVETSRGCPFNCVFCSAHVISGRKWRPRAVDDVISEIKYLKRKYHCRTFYFTDDNATVNPDRWTELMRQIIEADLNLNLYIPEGIQAHHLDFETLQLMKQAGFKHFFIGAESGVQRVLDAVIDKGGLTVEQTQKVVEICRKLKLQVSCFFIIGMPGETLEEARQTVKFAQKMRESGAYSCMVRNALPILGTRLCRQCLENSYLTVPEKALCDYNLLHSGKHFISTPEWSPQQIEELVGKAQKQDSQHILFHKQQHLLTHGVVNLIRQPKETLRRLKQLTKKSI